MFDLLFGGLELMIKVSSSLSTGFLTFSLTFTSYTTSSKSLSLLLDSTADSFFL